MAAVSVLGPGAYPRPPYGSFVGKPGSTGRSGLFSVLGPGGYPRPPYASFAGKPTSGARSGHFSVLGPGGYPRPPYQTALFASKTTGAAAEYSKPFFATMGQLMIIYGAASSAAFMLAAEDAVTFYVAEDGTTFYIED